MSIRAALALGLLAAAALLPLGGVGAHAFVNRSEPRAGATVTGPLGRIRVWFDGPVEPMFVTLRVENQRKQRVDSGDARVNGGDGRLLEVGLPALPRGRYRVYWSVVARDGHPRNGDFAFGVK